MREKKHEIHSCAHCGKEFKVFHSYIVDGCGKYCRIECARQGRSNFPAILGALPGTLAEIVEKAGIGEKSVARTVTRMAARGMLHAVKLAPAPSVEGKKQSALVLYFEAGPSPLEDAPLHLRELLYWLYDRVILKAMPGGQDDIARKTGIPQSSVSTHLTAMHKARMCHIKDWKPGEKGKGKFVAVWKRGKGLDAPCTLRALTAAEHHQNRIRRVVEAGKMEEFRHRRQDAQKRLRLRRRGDPLINALFGAPKERKVA